MLCGERSLCSGLILVVILTKLNPLLKPNGPTTHGRGAQLDARDFRVTVWLNAAGTISSIDQEIAVGLPEGVQNGHALNHALIFGLNSAQVAWHRLPGGVHIVDGKMTKHTPDGEVPFPES